MIKSRNAPHSVSRSIWRASVAPGRTYDPTDMAEIDALIRKGCEIPRGLLTDAEKADWLSRPDARKSGGGRF